MKNKFYKVDLYQVLGPRCSAISKSICDVDSIGKIIVSASKRDGTNKNIGKCREVLEDFKVCVVDCSRGSYFDAWYAESVTEFCLPYNYDYWNKYMNFIILASDLNDSNLATEQDIKLYEPKKEVWYKVLKEINEKGIDFDYKHEATNILLKEIAMNEVKKDEKTI